ncbi:MAG: FixJ family two-component response regulator [Candidatus Midichloriaceae bacterium]|jgi:FixJ family two-component response regulator
MKSNFLPLFKFPTSIALIDDDALFVKSSAEYLLTLSDKFKINIYTSAEPVLSKLKNYDNLVDYIKPIMPNYRENDAKFTLEFDLKQIFNNIDYSDIITVIVVDYDMPSMDGITFLEKIKDLKIYKILLTGVADESKAIEAFNRGIINCYLKKDEKKLFSNLYNKIIEGQDAVFSDATNALAYTICQTELNTLLENEGYKEIVNHYIEKHNIIYYKVLDETGSYYMRSRKKEYILYIIPEKKNNALVECIRDSIVDKNLNKGSLKKLLVKLKNNEVIVFDKLIYSEELDMMEIEHFCKKSKLYKANDKIYYYYFSDNIFSIKGKKQYHVNTNTL